MPTVTVFPQQQRTAGTYKTNAITLPTITQSQDVLFTILGSAATLADPSNSGTFGVEFDNGDGGGWRAVMSTDWTGAPPNAKGSGNVFGTSANPDMSGWQLRGTMTLNNAMNVGLSATV